MVLNLEWKAYNNDYCSKGICQQVYASLSEVVADMMISAKYLLPVNMVSFCKLIVQSLLCGASAVRQESDVFMRYRLLPTTFLLLYIVTKLSISGRWGDLSIGSWLHRTPASQQRHHAATIPLWVLQHNCMFARGWQITETSVSATISRKGLTGSL